MVSLVKSGRTSAKIHRNLLSESGVAFLETAIVMPFCLFLVCGALFGGRVFSQMATMNQAAYLGSVLGAAYPDVSTTHDAMRSRAKTIAEGNQHPATIQNSPSDVSYDAANRVVRMEVNADIDLFQNVGFLHSCCSSISKIKTGVTAPIFVRDSAAAQNLGTPANPTSLVACGGSVVCLN